VIIKLFLTIISTVLRVIDVRSFSQSVRPRRRVYYFIRAKWMNFSYKVYLLTWYVIRTFDSWR